MVWRGQLHNKPWKCRNFPVSHFGMWLPECVKLKKKGKKSKFKCCQFKNRPANFFSLTKQWVQVTENGSRSLEKLFHLIFFLCHSSSFLIGLHSFAVEQFLFSMWRSLVFVFFVSVWWVSNPCMRACVRACVYIHTREGLGAVWFNSILKQCQKRLCLSDSVSIWSCLTCSGLFKW